MNIAPDRRIGRIRVDYVQIAGNPDVVVQTMSKYLVLDLRHEFDTNVIEYLAWSPDWPELAMGLQAPVYVEISTPHLEQEE